MVKGTAIFYEVFVILKIRANKQLFVVISTGN